MACHCCGDMGWYRGGLLLAYSGSWLGVGQPNHSLSACTSPAKTLEKGEKGFQQRWKDSDPYPLIVSLWPPLFIP